MIKILFIISHLTGGGAEHVARKNIECLINNQDYKLGVVTSDSNWNNVNVIKYKMIDFRCISNVIKKAISTIGIHENYRLMEKYLLEFKPDIIHIHDYISFTPKLMRAIKEYKSKTACKVIMTHHTYSYICTNDALYNYSQDRLCEKCIGKFDASIITEKCTGNYITSIAKFIQKKLFIKQLYNLIDINISPSLFLRDMLVKADKSCNVVNVNNPCLDEISSDYNTNRSDTIVFFGRVNKEKNIVKFTEIFSKCETNLKLLIIGNGNSSNEIKSIVKSNVSNNIEFINNFLETEDLYKVVQNIKYFVLPSKWYENSPVSIVEAINLGMIPIVSNIGGMKELIEYFNVGYVVDINDEKAVKSLIVNLNSSYEDDCEKMKKAREKLDLFLVKHYQKSIEKIYKKSIAK